MISFNEMLDISNLVKKTEKKERIQTLDKALDEINNANSIVILTHESPDGDAIGSSMAMKHILDYLGKNADVIMSEYSRMYNFLPKINEIKKESEIKHYDFITQWAKGQKVPSAFRESRTLRVPNRYTLLSVTARSIGISVRSITTSSASWASKASRIFGISGGSFAR